ncbi:sialin isoform X2 [Bacillus rossius redtenbacheri]|uniref:sialin isoform X2 n=1 Tax=Bacillus rossius redtenbacheri TaxID=93214 RepID=UPI002FDE116C
MVEAAAQTARRRCRDAVPARLVVAVMAFLACWINYMLRINMTVAIIAMAPPVESAQSDPACAPLAASGNTSTSISAVPDLGPRYDWGPDVTYAVLGAYFWGNLLTCLPGGLLADRMGGRRVVLWTTLASGLLTLLLPALAQLHWAPLVACRLLVGFCGLGPRYDWGPDVTYAVLGAYFWGNLLTCLPGGLLADRMGGRRVVLWTTLASGLLTLLLPALAQLHWAPLVACRLLVGFCGGPCWPSLHSLFSKWAPPEEKSKFIWSLFGGVFSTIVMLPLGGAVVQSLGWPAFFYGTGSLAVLWCGYWWYLVHDSPHQHPRISPEERDYITRALAGATGGKRPRFPARRVLTSLPFWVLVGAHFGNLCGLFFLQSMAPKYMSDVLGFDIEQSAGLASLPYVARLLFGLGFSYVSDWLLSSHRANTWTVRRWFTVSSHLVPGALLAAMGFTGCDPALSVALLTLALGANGASTITNLVNQHDLAPNFAGDLYGIMNTFGTLAGGLSPVLVSFITREKSGLQEWRLIMGVVGAVYCVTGLQFMLLGTADRQPWNEPQHPEETTESQGPAVLTTKM